MVKALAATVVFAALILTGCGYDVSGARSGVTVLPAAASNPSPIKHVVILIQENRSFDNFFATFPGATAQRQV